MNPGLFPILSKVGSGQWAVGSGQWAVGSGQWAVWAVCSGQWHFRCGLNHYVNFFQAHKNNHRSHI